MEKVSGALEEAGHVPAASPGLYVHGGNEREGGEHVSEFEAWHCTEGCSCACAAVRSAPQRPCQVAVPGGGAWEPL